MRRQSFCEGSEAMTADRYGTKICNKEAQGLDTVKYIKDISSIKEMDQPACHTVPHKIRL